MLCRHNGFSVLSQPSCSPCPQGFFLSFLSHMLPLQGTGSQEGSMGMVAPFTNQLYTRSKAFISVLKLWMVLIFHDELPQPNERDWGWWWRGGGQESMRLKEKIQEEFFAFTPPGRSVCWWSTVRFSGKRISTLPTHASLSNQMKSQRRSSFMQSGVCVLLCCAPPLN